MEVRGCYLLNEKIVTNGIEGLGDIASGNGGSKRWLLLVESTSDLLRHRKQRRRTRTKGAEAVLVRREFESCVARREEETLQDLDAGREKRDRPVAT